MGHQRLERLPFPLILYAQSTVQSLVLLQKQIYITTHPVVFLETQQPSVHLTSSFGGGWHAGAAQVHLPVYYLPASCSAMKRIWPLKILICVSEGNDSNSWFFFFCQAGFPLSNAKESNFPNPSKTCGMEAELAQGPPFLQLTDFTDLSRFQWRRYNTDKDLDAPKSAWNSFSLLSHTNPWYLIRESQLIEIVLKGGMGFYIPYKALKESYI